MSLAVAESAWAQAEIALGVACFAGAIWLGLTGRTVRSHIRTKSDRFLRAGALGGLGLLALSQGAPVFVGHGSEFTLLGIVGLAGVVGLGLRMVTKKPSG